jgi:hypothetical protein
MEYQKGEIVVVNEVEYEVLYYDKEDDTYLLEDSYGYREWVKLSEIDRRTI